MTRQYTPQQYSMLATLRNRALYIRDIANEYAGDSMCIRVMLEQDAERAESELDAFENMLSQSVNLNQWRPIK